MNRAQSNWEDIAADIRRQVDEGELGPGAVLAPRGKLADSYGVSAGPVNRAVLQLIHEGVLMSDPSAPRRGVWVRDSGGMRATAPGLVQYRMWIPIPDDNGTDIGDSITFAAYGRIVPRIGEHLHFDTTPLGLLVTVVDVGHWFTPDEDPSEVEPYELTVEGAVEPTHLANARKLLNPATLCEWIDRFPHLEYTRAPSVAPDSAVPPIFPE